MFGGDQNKQTGQTTFSRKYGLELETAGDLWYDVFRWSDATIKCAEEAP